MATIDPIDLFLRIEKAMADDSILIVDGGDFVATGSYIVRPRAPLSWLDPVCSGHWVLAGLCRWSGQCATEC